MQHAEPEEQIIQEKRGFYAMKRKVAATTIKAYSLL